MLRNVIYTNALDRASASCPFPCTFSIAAIAVAAFSDTDTPLPVSPCGACRQALIEFGIEAGVSFRQPDGSWVEVDVDALLPYRFILPAQ